MMSNYERCHEYLYKMGMYTMLWVAQQSIAYAFNQVQSSNIDILGETKEENLKLLAQVYLELDQLNLGRHEQYIEEDDVLHAVRGTRD